MTELTVSSRNLSVDDAPKIAAAISQLEKIGLKPLFPEREFPALARRMAEEFEGTGIPEPPLPLTWVDLALSGSKQVFAEPADGSTNSGAGAWQHSVPAHIMPKSPGFVRTVSYPVESRPATSGGVQGKARRRS
jgi:hypothetical protein